MGTELPSHKQTVLSLIFLPLVIFDRVLLYITVRSLTSPSAARAWGFPIDPDFSVGPHPLPHPTDNMSPAAQITFQLIEIQADACARLREPETLSPISAQLWRAA